MKKAPWKYQLSDHKDKVVRHRDALYGKHQRSNQAPARQGEGSSNQFSFAGTDSKIEEPINKAIKGAGLLDDHPEEEPVAGGIRLGDEVGVLDVADKTTCMRQRMWAIRQGNDSSDRH